MIEPYLYGTDLTLIKSETQIVTGIRYMATTDTLPAGVLPPLDHFGVEVKPGDRLVVAFRAGNSAEIRTGIILGYDTRKDSYRANGLVLLLDIEWEKGYVKHSKIETHHKRFVKIN